MGFYFYGAQKRMHPVYLFIRVIQFAFKFFDLVVFLSEQLDIVLRRALGRLRRCMFVSAELSMFFRHADAKPCSRLLKMDVVVCTMTATRSRRLCGAVWAAMFSSCPRRRVLPATEVSRAAHMW